MLYLHIMNIFHHKTLTRYIFILIAVLIAVGSLLVSNSLVKDLQKEEENKIRIWAEATKEIVSSEESISLNLIMQILESNETIPVVLFDKKENSYTSHANIDVPEGDIQAFLKEKTVEFSNRHAPIIIEVADFEQYVYYDDSYTLKRLRLYPYIQLGVVGIFMLISLLAVLSTKRMEQDRVWLGLTKETAHQLGTPLSSLLAWIEYMKLKDIDSAIVSDMEKDIGRLQVITDRFSKIGSKEVLETCDIGECIEHTLAYLKSRISQRVLIRQQLPCTPIFAKVNEPLLSWVLENLIKNAVDAMGGVGDINIYLIDDDKNISILISDTGKGISKSQFKTVFNPGFTTKTRGWGLGLSLAKRIIETYHKGKIYVKSSELGIGTTFCIELKKITR